MTVSEWPVMITLIVLLAIQPVCYTKSTYFVKPTPDTPCPSEPCLTLSEYAQGAGLPFTSNTTMVFLPGDHRLDNDMIVTNITSFTMVGDSSTLPEITSNIVCTGPAAIVFQNISHLKIHALELSYCGSATQAAMQLRAVPQFELSNSKFLNSRNTSLNATGSSLTISDARFHGSSSAGLILSGCVAEFLGRNVFSKNLRSGVLSFDSLLTFNGSTSFVSNSGEYGGGIIAIGSIVHCSGSIHFHSNKVVSFGGGVFASGSIVSGDGDISFVNNSADSGGGVCLGIGRLTFTGNITFIGNSASHGGGLIILESSLGSSGNIAFVANHARIKGGGIIVWYSTVLCEGNNTFINNSANYGGGMAMYESNLTFSGNMSFTSNKATYSGGGIYVENSTLSGEGNSTFMNNSAIYGGGIVMHEINLTFNGNMTFTSNRATYSGGGIYVENSTMSYEGNNIYDGKTKLMYGANNGNGMLEFMNNSAVFGGAFMVLDGTNLTAKGNCTFTNNTAEYSGGAVIIISGSSVILSGYNRLVKNSADYGGGIHLTDSNLKLMGTTIFLSNSATNGGGVYGTRAAITINGNTTFDRNYATMNGGGLSISSTSQCSLAVNKTTYFTGNHAGKYGGAVFIVDDPFVHCTSAAYYNLWGQCVFQLLEWNKSPTSICCITANNTAGEAGGVMYGGMVDRCKLTPLTLDPGQVFDELFDITEHSSRVSVISSTPNHVCPCSNGQPGCSTHSVDIMVYPGETFLVPVVAVGQRNGTVPAVVKTSLSDEQSMLGSLQGAQPVNNTCTALQYTIFSNISKETMTLETEGPCLELGDQLIINVTLLQCPTGFMLSNSTKGCTCEKRLQKYTTNCNITSRKIGRDGEFWVGVDNDSGGIILHPHCPFDYCKPQPVSFALNETDLECNYDRAGLLCGGCQPGLSNVLESSHCLQCSNAYLSLLIPFTLAGIVLVVFILLCKLTVTVGSINGLIFYANIIAVNHSVFLPSGQGNVLAIFIAWLNLDLGIKTCFYDGMDTYARTWLQFVFPLYVWVMVGTIVVLSHYYGTVARMFGRNPIAVLATLFLLSYAKLLRTIIAVLSFTYLEYPDGTEVAVWLYDGNVRYLKGKHIPLFLTALLVLLLLFLPYTLLLLFGQWIQAHSEMRMFSWISDYRVKPFLDAYHAPYRNENRYWPGLLLVLRCILFLVFAFNVLGNPSVNLLAISVCVTLLGIILTRFTGKVYTNQYLDAIDASYLLNTGVLATGTLYVRSVGGQQEILVYISLSIAFTTFIGILMYHVITQVRYSHLWKRISLPKLQPMMQWTVFHRNLSDTDTQRAEEPEIVSHAPTTTYINLRELLLEENS